MKFKTLKNCLKFFAEETNHGLHKGDKPIKV